MVRKVSKETPPRVFLIGDVSHFDTSSAETYGKITNLIEQSLRINPFYPGNASSDLMDAFMRVEFDPERDYICMTGNALILAITLSVATSMYDRVRLLLFDARKSVYWERKMSSPRLLLDDSPVELKEGDKDE